MFERSHPAASSLSPLLWKNRSKIFAPGQKNPMKVKSWHSPRGAGSLTRGANENGCSSGFDRALWIDTS